MNKKERKSLVELDNPKISKRRQCQLLGVSRSSLYYEPKGFSEMDLRIMRAIDEQYLKTPFHGIRRMYHALKKQGFQVGRNKVGRLMRHMGLVAMVPGPHTSKKKKDHKIYILICLETGRSADPTRYGALISPTCPCRVVSCTW